MIANNKTRDTFRGKHEYDFYQLIDWLVSDIQKLESRIIYLRYVLSGYLPEADGKALKSEIFSDLSGGYYDNPAYRQYVSDYCGGQDPLNCPDFDELTQKLSAGEEIFEL